MSNVMPVIGSRVLMADGTAADVKEKGTAKLVVNGKNMKLENILRVPNLKGNLISVA